MKILFVSSGNSIEGINAMVLNQAASLKNEGCDISYFNIVGKGLYGYLSHTLKLRHLLKENKFAIIHAHYGLCGVIAFLAKKKEKLIVSFMGDDILGSNNYKGKLTFMSKIMVRLNYYIARKGINHIIVKTQEMADKLRLYMKVSVIPNGVNLQTFKPEDKNSSRIKLKQKADKTFAIFVSDPKRPEKNFKLAETAAKKAGIELITLYNETQETITNFYNAADMLLLTSFHEGSVNVIKEAMACNCPIVSTDVGDVRYVIGNTAGSYICSYNPDEVADKINHALHFSQTKGRTAGRHRIIELGLDSESIAKRIIEIYNLV